MTWAARLLPRWDIGPAQARALTFDHGLAALNLRRLELACLLALTNDAIELASGGRVLPAVLAQIAVMLSVLAVGWKIEHSASRRVQRLTVQLFIVAGLLSTQWVVWELADQGRVGSGYLIRLLTAALLFVMPPVEWGLVLGGCLLSYAAVLMALPVSTGLKLTSAVNAGIVSAISLVAGWLIYLARRTDHEQQRLIASQNDRLIAQHVELDQLMAVTAHDLRSPLLGMRNLFDLALRRGDGDPAMPRRVMRDGIASLDTMLSMVTRLLEAHKAEHHPLAAAVQHDARVHLQAAAQRVAPRAEAAAVRIEVTLPSAPLWATFDAGALAHILDNLLSNAVRFSPTGQAVRLAAAAGQDGRVSVTVEDAGPGIDPALQGRLFRRFPHGAGDGGRGDDAGGGGLGLFIAATYATRIAATLAYERVDACRSVFLVSLPAGSTDAG